MENFCNRTSIDFFSKPYQLMLNGKTSHSTVTSISFTFIFIIIMMIGVFELVKDQIIGNNSYTEIRKEEKLEFSRIQMNEYPLFFSFIDNPGQYLPQASKYIRMEIT